MNHQEHLTKYTASFVDELVCSGLRHVVISPGSRSTPLAIMFAAHDSVEDWVIVDERSAAFFALGIAKETNMPVALVCTSGTAAANYYPAIIEAYHARVPLLVLTADRPHELRGIGASQTMNQIGLYGNFVKLFYEMAPPSAKQSMLQYVRNRANRAMQTARMGNAGPVHLNFPFREPLMPKWNKLELKKDDKEVPFNPIVIGKKHIQKQELQFILEKIIHQPNGLLVCGPQTDADLSSAIVSLAEKLNVPILADPLSQLRAGQHRKNTIISTYDAIFKSEKMRQQLKPSYIIRFGAMPISKHYLFYVQEHSDVLQIVVENDADVREPTNHHSEYVVADSEQLCKDLTELIPEHEQSATSNWLTQWQKYEQLVQTELKDETNDMTEGIVVRDVVATLPDESFIFVANSMPVRDMDTFFPPTYRKITIHANRGLSGIDGTMSTALGVAAAARKRVFLFIGDLSFYHDMNSLQIAKQYHLPLTVVLINNNGGGIFSFLPQANDKTYFERIFGTPLHVQFHPVVQMFGGKYFAAENYEEFQHTLEQIDSSSSHLKVIEVQTNREDNVRWHRKVWDNISQRLHADEKNSNDK